MTYLTVKEAADEVRRHPDTIRKALESGELHGYQRVPRGKWLIKPEWLEEWLTGPRLSTLSALRAQKRAMGR